MRGTATTPLITALQNNALIGLIGEYWMTIDEHADGDIAVEAARVGRFAFRASLPVHGLAYRVRGGAGEHRHADQADNADAEREQREGEAAACAAVSMSVTSATWRVTAVAGMMK